ncbi:MAG: flavodoxin family protein [Victivallales bacterium]|nr:flavodoxin family protein [Victivallales bacterium]
MGKKILIVTGSPRHHGNTNTLADGVAQGATDRGGKVKIVDAARLQSKTNGCTSCMGCQESEDFRCIIRDEVSEILATIPDYDVLVLATPVYFFNFSAQIKIFIDRMYSLYKFKEDKIITPTEKLHFAMIATAAGDYGSGLDSLEHTFNKIAGLSGRKPLTLLVPLCSVDVNETMADTELKEQAIRFGAQLAE